MLIILENLPFPQQPITTRTRTTPPSCIQRTFLNVKGNDKQTRSLLQDHIWNKINKIRTNQFQRLFMHICAHFSVQMRAVVQTFESPNGRRESLMLDLTWTKLDYRSNYWHLIKDYFVKWARKARNSCSHQNSSPPPKSIIFYNLTISFSVFLRLEFKILGWRCKKKKTAHYKLKIITRFLKFLLY